MALIEPPPPPAGARRSVPAGVGAGVGSGRVGAGACEGRPIDHRRSGAASAAGPAGGPAGGRDEDARDQGTRAQGDGGGSMATLVGTVVGAAANFALLALIGAAYGPEAFGLFAGVTALFLVLAMVTRLGADQGALWSVSRLLARGRAAAVPDVLRVALVPVALVAVVVALGVAAGADAIAARLAGGASADDYAVMLRVVALAIPFAAAGEVLLGITRGFGSMRPTVVASQLGRQVGQLLFVGAAVLVGSQRWLLAAAWALPYVGTVLYPAWWLRGRLGQRHEDVDRTAFWRYSGSQAANQSAQIGLEKIDIILLGPMASLAAQGSYNAANRLTHLAVLAWYALMLPHSPRWGRWFEQGRVTEVVRSARRVTGWGILVIGPLLVSYVLYGAVWTGLLSPGLAQGGPAIAVLAGGLLATLLLGPCENLLLMAGRSGRSFVNNLVALAIDIGLNLLLIPRYGAVGAAAAWVVALSAVRLSATVMLWRECRVTSWSASAVLAMGVVMATFGVVGVAVRELLDGPSRQSLVASVAISFPLFVAALVALRRPLALQELLGVARGPRPAPGANWTPSPAGPVVQPAQAGQPVLADRPRLGVLPAQAGPGGGVPAANQRYVAMVEASYLHLRIRSAAAVRLPVTPDDLRMLLDLVPAIGIRGRMLRRALVVAAPWFGRRPQMLPRLSVCRPLVLPFDRTVLAEVLETAATRLGRDFDAVVWLLPPATTERRLGVLLLEDGRRVGHLRITEGHCPTVVRPQPTTGRGTRSGVEWPLLLVRWQHGELAAELSTALPPGVYRPARLPIEQLVAVSEDLAETLWPPFEPGSATGHPAMHGDLTPWNLLQSSDGRLVLFDWEHAGYAPAGADLARYLANAEHGDRLAAGLPPQWQAALAAASTYWLREIRRRSFGEPTGWQRRGRRAEIGRLIAMGGRDDREAELVADYVATLGPPAAVRLPGGPPVEPPTPCGMGDVRLFAAAAAVRRPLLAWTVAVAVAATLSGLGGVTSHVVSGKVLLRDPWGADPTVAEVPVGGDFERFVRGQAQRFGSDLVLSAAAEAAVVDPQRLADAVSVAPDESATQLVVVVRAPTDTQARAWFTAVLDTYRTVRSAEVGAAAEAQLADLAEEQRRLPGDGVLVQRERDLRLALQRYGDGVASADIDEEGVGVEPPWLALRAVLGVFGGVASGLGVAWLVGVRKERRRDPGRLASALAARPIGTVRCCERPSEANATDLVAYAHAAAALWGLVTPAAPRLRGRPYTVVVVADELGTAVTAAVLTGGARQAGIGVDLAVVDEPVLDAVLDRLERPTWERTELLLLACPPANGSSVALRLAEVADAVLIVAGERTPRADLVRTAGRLRRLDTGELLVLLTIDA